MSWFKFKVPSCSSPTALFTAASQAASYFTRAEDDDERGFWSGCEAALFYAGTLAQAGLEVGFLRVADDCPVATAVLLATRATKASPSNATGSFLVWDAVLAGTLARLAASEGREGIEEEAFS